MRQVRCNKCGYVGTPDTFYIDRDFFQRKYIAGCPKCNNRLAPGDASMAMFGGKPAFEWVSRQE